MILLTTILNVYVRKYDFMFMFVLCPLLFPYREGNERNSACKTDQTNFTDWMSFLPSNLIEEIGPKTEDIGTNT